MMKLLVQLYKKTSLYTNTFETYKSLPTKGLAKGKVLETMKKMSREESQSWKNGFVSGTVYHGNEEHINFLNEVYSIHSQTNPIHSDIWPSINKYENEIVSMTAKILGSEKTNSDIFGSVSSGGTESILLAVKAYRDYAYEKKRIKKPEMIVPISAHTAFDKACDFFKIKKITSKVDKEFKADVKDIKKLITKNTILIVGSAPSFPHGIIDPIPEMSDLALKHKIPFHTDACLGGFILPWVSKKHKVPNFDFSLPGVSSISIDTHKYGYASKGSSVILYRGNEIRNYQFYSISSWPGGLYFSPTLAGSRPGALIAQCWASMISIGEEGYKEATDRIISSASELKRQLQEIEEIEILGNPLWVIAFTSRNLNIYEIMDAMGNKGWHLNGLHKPACVHL